MAVLGLKREKCIEKTNGNGKMLSATQRLIPARNTQRQCHKRRPQDLNARCKDKQAQEELARPTAEQSVPVAFGGGGCAALRWCSVWAAGIVSTICLSARSQPPITLPCQACLKLCTQNRRDCSGNNRQVLVASRICGRPKLHAGMR